MLAWILRSFCIWYSGKRLFFFPFSECLDFVHRKTWKTFEIWKKLQYSLYSSVLALGGNFILLHFSHSMQIAWMPEYFRFETYIICMQVCRYPWRKILYFSDIISCGYMAPRWKPEMLLGTRAREMVFREQIAERTFIAYAEYPRSFWMTVEIQKFRVYVCRKTEYTRRASQKGWIYCFSPTNDGKNNPDFIFKDERYLNYFHVCLVWVLNYSRKHRFFRLWTLVMRLRIH